MKKLALILLLTSPLTATAQSDYAATWTIIGTISSGYNKLELDINQGSRFLSVNGILRTASNSGTPVSGSCMFLTGGAINCNISSGFGYYVVDIGTSLNGTIKLMDSLTGNASASAAIEFVSIK